MNMSAEKITRLLPLQKLPHRLTPGMPQISNPVEHSPQRRNMADRNHRFQAIELMQALGKLFFRIFSRRIEGRGIRIPQTNNLKSRDFNPPALKIVQPETAAQIRH